MQFAAALLVALLGLQSPPLPPTFDQVLPAQRFTESTFTYSADVVAGDPAGAQYHWSQVWGPAPLAIAKPDQQVTAVAFITPGSYSLRCDVTIQTANGPASTSAFYDVVYGAQFNHWGVDTTVLRAAITVVSNSGAGDTEAPVIVSVVSSAGSVNVLPGGVRIPANGVPFTIVATDNVGVLAAKLYVDGIQGPGDGGGNALLPELFYLRWNAPANLAAGVHNFRLIVWDASGNLAARTWSMVR